MAWRWPRAEPFGDVLDLGNAGAFFGDGLAHHVLPERRRRDRDWLAIIETRMAPPRIRKNGLALMPMRLTPFCSSASTSEPSSAPMMVPEPPARAVPPMTAAEMAVNVMPVPPPRLGSMVCTRNASMIPANA